MKKLVAAGKMTTKTPSNGEKDLHIQINVTEEQKTVLQKRADARGLSLAGFIRMRALLSGD